MSSLDAATAGAPKSCAFPEAVEPTSSVPFQDEVAWTIRLKDYVTVACHRYQLLSAFMMALMALLIAFIIHGDAFGWLQQNSAVATTMAVFAFFIRRSFFSTRSVYCIDHCEFNPPDEWKVSRAEIIKILSTDKNLSPESLAFMKRLLSKSGTSDKTAFPPNLTGERWSATLEDSREEAETAMGEALRGLMDKTGITARDIDVLIINCSLLSPTPSLCALLVSKFGMRSDILTYNLS
ncbi:conserved hypothetical protein, partial [Perkinsus marinus ATCC 50983]